ncbi:MAG: type IX secretion system sortase PorU [Bacteroidetes bacterium]|nr:type IX secretion system sortase PorU [Bacteroidota bacterium]
MKHVVAYIVLLTTTVQVVLAQNSIPLRIVQQTPTFVDIEFNPSVRQSIRLGSDGKEYGWYDFEYSHIGVDSRSGLLFFYAMIPVVLPDSFCTIQILTTESFETQVLPPNAEALGISSIQKEFKEDRIAWFTDFSHFHEYTVASLILRPVEFIDVSRTRLYTKFVLRIQSTNGHLFANNPLALCRWNTGSELEATSTRTIKKLTGVPSPLATGTWYRFTIQETGIYKLDYSYFKSQNIPATVWNNINEIRIYGNGGIVVPQNTGQPYPDDLQEIARLVVDNNKNGTFDTDDYILFYGVTPRMWVYKDKSITHVLHPYTETNNCFLTSTPGIPGKAMSVLESISSNTIFQPAYFLDGVFVEQEKYNLIKSGRRWVGQRFDANTQSAIYTNTLYGIISSLPIEYRFVFYVRSSTSDAMTITENGQNLLTISLPSMVVNQSDNQGYYAQTRQYSFKTIRQIPDNRSVVKFQYSPMNANGIAWLDWFEIIYYRSFDAVNNFLLWWGYDTTGYVQYEVKNLSSADVYAFDVTEHSNVKVIIGLQTEPANPTVRRFTVYQAGGTIRRFAIVGLNGTKTPSTAERVDNSNLHGVTDRIDYIIITPKEFETEANRLKNHRETRDTIRTLVATIEAVYNEFSGGLQDPMAIRNFLKYAYERWPTPPKYVLLFGSGHYDYKNITTTLKNWIPPFETDESNYQIMSYCTDDSLVLWGNSSRVMMGLGRLPVRTKAQAKSVVDKIIRYETESPFDEWRSRITFVADDEFPTRVVGDSASTTKEYFHAEDTEILARGYVPATMEKNKIFLSQYPDVITAAGRRKPGAAEALITAINNGTLILNYAGHGNETVWAHEEVFSQSSTLPQLTNQRMLLLLIAATCDFALYDDPSVFSAGEEFVTMANGGAIVGISAARPVYANQNIALNREILRQLFLRDTYGNVPRIGDVIKTVKQFYNTVNDKKYHLFGDPTLRILIPRYTVAVDSINDESPTSLVTVKALGKIRIASSVRSKDSSIIESYNGDAIVKIYGPTRVLRFNNWPKSDSFLVHGAILYSGKVSVRNGTMMALARLPKDVVMGNNARLAVYCWDNNIDGIGVTENILINDIDTSDVSDSRGPQVTVYFDNEMFRNGDVVPQTTRLIVRVEDESGVNTSVLGIGHGLRASLERPPSVIDLSSYYKNDRDTYQRGEAQYVLRNLPLGKNSIRVKAWDIHNNSSEVEVAFEVVEYSKTEITRINNYPNPFSQSTFFTFQRSSGDPIAIEIKIYTLAGRLVRTLSLPVFTERYGRILWDGYDTHGDNVANGIYIYKIITKDLITNDTKEYIGKLARVQ